MLERCAEYWSGICSGASIDRLSVLQLIISRFAEEVQESAHLERSCREVYPAVSHGMTARQGNRVLTTLDQSGRWSAGHEVRERGKSVTQILPTGFARHPFRRSGRLQQPLAWCLEVLMGLAIWVFASLASAQATPGPPRVQDKPAAAAPVQQLAHPVARVPISPALVPEQTLPQPPEIAWDGKQLTIDAENSKLSDVLLAVRAKTGASIDFPAGAASERVAVHLGPAPAREVLSSLLYGTTYDYVIQAAEDDPDALRNVVLTARGKGDDSVAADGAVVAADTGKTPVRMMRGYAAPGKPAFQAAGEAALAAEQAVVESAAAAAESAATTDGAAPTAGQGSAASGPESASAGAAPTNTDPNSTPAAAATIPADGSAVAGSDIPPTTTATSGGNSGEQSEVSRRMQDMVRMFEQRRQIQAEQNRAAAAPPASN